MHAVRCVPTYSNTNTASALFTPLLPYFLFHCEHWEDPPDTGGPFESKWREPSTPHAFQIHASIIGPAGSLGEKGHFSGPNSWINRPGSRSLFRTHRACAECSDCHKFLRRWPITRAVFCRCAQVGQACQTTQEMRAVAMARRRRSPCRPWSPPRRALRSLPGASRWKCRRRGATFG